MRDSIHVLIQQEDVSDTAWVGHLLEQMGRIPHDEALADQMGNDMARAALREAEAFESGYRAGRAGLMDDSEDGR